MAELSVSRRTISALFLQTKKFVIPEFQRPYSWDVEKCDTLWTDIVFLKEFRWIATCHILLYMILRFLVSWF